MLPKFVTIRCLLSNLKYTKIVFNRGSTVDHAKGAYHLPQTLSRLYTYVLSDNSSLFNIRFTCHKIPEKNTINAFFQTENAPKP